MSMERSNRASSFAAVFLAGLAWPVFAGAAENTFYGLLRERDLTPFGFLRLDMRPAHAVSIEAGTLAIETELGYQNTWALSENVEEYLKSLEPTGRRELGPAELAAIQSLPGENYLIDLELAAFDVIFHYKFSDIWTAYLITSAVSYHGGFLDGTIESFHDTFGFSSFGRQAVSRNDVNVVYDLKSVQLASFGAPSDGGFLDPTLGVRYIGVSLPNPWSMALEAAIQVPVGGERAFLSTGELDYGLQASLQRRGANHAFYANAAAVYYGGSEFPVPDDAQLIPTLILGYERALTERTNVNFQVYASTSVYGREQTDLDELTGEKYQYSIGLRHRTGSFLITFGFTENVQNINNTPDIGFQLGVAYVPRLQR
jgi:Protein of unknown function (DUF3187)